MFLKMTTTLSNFHMALPGAQPLSALFDCKSVNPNGFFAFSFLPGQHVISKASVLSNLVNRDLVGYTPIPAYNAMKAFFLCYYTPKTISVSTYRNIIRRANDRLLASDEPDKLRKRTEFLRKNLTFRLDDPVVCAVYFDELVTTIGRLRKSHLGQSFSTHSVPNFTFVNVLGPDFVENLTSLLHQKVAEKAGEFALYHKATHNMRSSAGYIVKLSDLSYEKLFVIKASNSSSIEKQRAIEELYHLEKPSIIDTDDVSATGRVWRALARNIYQITGAAGYGLHDRSLEFFNDLYSLSDLTCFRVSRITGMMIYDFSALTVPPHPGESNTKDSKVSKSRFIRNILADPLALYLDNIKSALFPCADPCWPIFSFLINGYLRLLSTSKSSTNENESVYRSALAKHIAEGFADSASVGATISCLRLLDWFRVDEAMLKENPDLVAIKITDKLLNYFDSLKTKHKVFFDNYFPGGGSTLSGSDKHLIVINVILLDYFQRYKDRPEKFKLDHFLQTFLFVELGITSHVRRLIRIIQDEHNKALTGAEGYRLLPRHASMLPASPSSRITQILFDLSHAFINNLVLGDGVNPKFALFEGVMIRSLDKVNRDWSAIRLIEPFKDSEGNLVPLVEMFNRLSNFTTLPMLCKPKDWKLDRIVGSCSSGGYLLNKGAVPLIHELTGGRSTIKFSVEGLASINLAQSKPYSLDEIVDLNDPRNKAEFGLESLEQVKAFKVEAYNIRNKLYNSANTEDEVDVNAPADLAAQIQAVFEKSRKRKGKDKAKQDLITAELGLGSLSADEPDNPSFIEAIPDFEDEKEKVLAKFDANPDIRIRNASRNYRLTAKLRDLGKKIQADRYNRHYYEVYIQGFFYPFFAGMDFFYPAYADARLRLYHALKGISKVSHKFLRSLLVSSESLLLNDTGALTLMLSVAQHFYKPKTRAEQEIIMKGYESYYRTGVIPLGLDPEITKLFSKMKSEDHPLYRVRRDLSILHVYWLKGQVSTSIMSEQDQSASGPTLWAFAFKDKSMALLSNALSGSKKIDIYTIWCKQVLKLFDSILEGSSSIIQVPKTPYDYIGETPLAAKKRILTLLNETDVSIVKLLTPEKIAGIRIILNSRDVAKILVMPFFYSMGSRGAQKALAKAQMEMLGKDQRLSLIELKALGNLVIASLGRLSPACTAGIRLVSKIAKLSVKYNTPFYYTHPDGIKGSFTYLTEDATYRRTQKGAGASNKRMRMVAFKQDKDGHEIVSPKQEIATGANWIHSLDAFIVRVVTSRFHEATGRILQTIHDAFFSHPNDVPFVNKLLKDIYIEFFQKYDFPADMIQANIDNALSLPHKEELKAIGLELTKLREALAANGDLLDLNDIKLQESIKKSDHMFY